MQYTATIKTTHDENGVCVYRGIYRVRLNDHEQELYAHYGASAFVNDARDLEISEVTFKQLLSPDGYITHGDDEDYRTLLTTRDRIEQALSSLLEYWTSIEVKLKPYTTEIQPKAREFGFTALSRAPSSAGRTPAR